MTCVLTTELDAVNTILEAVGMVPINVLEDDPNAEIALARNILDRTIRSVQKRGWQFNTEEDVQLNLSGTEIPLGQDMLRVVVKPARANGLKHAQRGLRLYNLTDHTFVYTANVLAEVVYCLDFEVLPEAAREYIAVIAARKFHDEIVGSAAEHRYSKEDEDQAQADLKSAEGQTANYSIFDSYDVAAVIDRHNDFLPYY